MEEKEIWKDVSGYEGLYQVSNLGRVKSLPVHRKVGWADYVSKEKILKQCKNKYGYLFVCLHKGDTQRVVKVHRLVALAFIANPNNLPCVNHKDENKENNFVFVNKDGSVDLDKSNLEWCTYSYNNNYGTKNERVMKSSCKRLLQYTKKGDFIAEWYGTRDAQRNTGIHCCNISLACRGIRKTAGGFVWKYKEV